MKKHWYICKYNLNGCVSAWQKVIASTAKKAAEKCVQRVAYGDDKTTMTVTVMGATGDPDFPKKFSVSTWKKRFIRAQEEE